MQTIEEYKAYTKQLECEVGKWHHAFDALMVERNQLAGKYAEINLRAASMAQRIAELETEIEGLKRSEKQAKELADPYTQFAKDANGSCGRDKFWAVICDAVSPPPQP